MEGSIEQGTNAVTNVNTYMHIRVTCAEKDCGGTNYNPCAHLIAGMLVDDDIRTLREQTEFEDYMGMHAKTLDPLRPNIRSALSKMLETHDEPMRPHQETHRDPFLTRRMRFFDMAIAKGIAKMEKDDPATRKRERVENLSTKLKRLKEEARTGAIPEPVCDPFPITSDPLTHQDIIETIETELVIIASSGYGYVIVWIDFEQGRVVFTYTNNFPADCKRKYVIIPATYDLKLWNQKFDAFIKEHPDYLNKNRMASKSDLFCKAENQLHHTWRNRHPDMIPYIPPGKFSHTSWVFEF